MAIQTHIAMKKLAKTTNKTPRTLGSGKLMPPNSRHKAVLLVYLRYMTEKLTTRLRRNNLQARQFYIGWRSHQQGWLGSRCLLPCPTQDSSAIYNLGKQILDEVWHGESVYQIQVTALNPHVDNQQQDFFASVN